MPVVEVDREAVEVRCAAACGRIALLQLLELERDVGNRRIDLAGQEEALPIWAQELRELRAGRESNPSMTRNGTTPVSAWEKSRK